MEWQRLSDFVLSSEWQLSPPTTATVFRIAHRFIGLYSYKVAAQIALCRTSSEGVEIFAPVKINPKTELDIVQFPTPLFGWSYCVAVKQLVLPNQSIVSWSVSVDMSTFSNAPTPPTSSNTINTTTVAVNVASTTLLAANSARVGAVIINNSTKGVLYVNFGAAASTTNYTYKLAINGGGVEGPFDYVGEIFGIWDKADSAGSAKVQEFI